LPKRISERDFDKIAEYIRDEKERRKKNRKDFDHAIKEIDRQVAMRPKTSHKMVWANGQNTGRPDPNKSWMPEIELPLQAEAREIHVADVRSMIFPESGPWFTAHSALTDKYLERVDFTSIIAGDDNEVPTVIDQDNADKLVVGQLDHWHRQYDFKGHVDLINSEAISYGVGVGRARMVKKLVVAETAKGLVKRDQMIPVLIPRSIKETYLDDREHIAQHEGFMVGPVQIFCRKIQLDDLKRQVKGNNDPNSEDGGWISKFINKLKPDDKGFVELIEADGDFLIPRSRDSIHLPNAVVTIAAGRNEPKIVRLRYRKEPFNSTIIFPYDREDIGSPYGTSPLRKGMPLQAAATELWQQMIMSAQLNNFPPVSFDKNDTYFISEGGPVIFPGAQWPTMGDVKTNPVGSMAEASVCYQNALMQYADVVGTHRSRLGAQTLSHTTAYAKNAELQRGAVRTVDYIRATLQGPMTQWLYMEYEMGRRNMTDNVIYIPGYRGFVDIGKDQLPDEVVFEAHGSGEPQEEQVKQQKKLQALSTAIQMDQISISQGNQPKLNIDKAIEEVLREGGWVDTDPFLSGGGEANIAQPVPLQALSAGMENG
jgi:hypothetical protein